MADSKVGVFFKTAAMWLLCVIFVIIGLAGMFTSFLAGGVLLLAACIFVPQFNRKIKDKLNVTVTPGARAVIAVVCLGLFFYTGSKSLDADRAQHQVQKALADQQKAEQAQKKNREDVAANKDAILVEMQSLTAKQDYSGAIALGSKYSNVGSLEIDQALSQVHAKKVDADKQQLKATLLISLGNIKQDDYKGLASTYSQLASIDQAYQPNADKFSKLSDQQVQEQKAREHAISEKARRQSMGLTWNYADSEDNMSGKLVRQAYVMSINTVDFNFPYRGVQRATLTIRKHPRWGTSVYVAIKKGQFVCGYDDCDVGVKFSKGNSRRMSASEPDDHSSNLLFISNASSFITQARKSDKVYIEASFYQEGSRVFEFDISDLEWK